MWILIIIVLLIAIIIFLCNELIRYNLKCISCLNNIDEQLKKEFKYINSLIKFIEKDYKKETIKLKEYLEQKTSTIHQKDTIIHDLKKYLDKLFIMMDDNKKNDINIRNIEQEIEIINKNINKNIDLYNESATTFNNLISKKATLYLSEKLNIKKKHLFTKNQ